MFNVIVRAYMEAEYKQNLIKAHTHILFKKIHQNKKPIEMNSLIVHIAI